MKLRSIICAMALVACFTATASADAIGIRFSGGELSTGAELNYQRNGGLFGSNRLEFGLSWDGSDHHSVIAGACVTQWHWNIAGGFNWYVGPGIAAGVYSIKPVKVAGHTVSDGKTELYVGIGGQIGIEFDFNALGAPLNLSVDTRPMVDVVRLDGFGLNSLLYLSLALRFTF